MNDDYFFVSQNNGCVISKNNMFVALASIVNVLFVLNRDNSHICNISAKRPRLIDLNPTYMLALLSGSYKREMHEEAPFGCTSNFV